MTVSVQNEDFNVNEENKALSADKLNVGALVNFVGLVRDIDHDAGLACMHLEHYPGMTEKSIEGILEEARMRWSVIDTRVIHRVGDLTPGDQIVYVGVTSAHRGDAFAACEFIMDYLKTRAPFWKKEITTQGEYWVEARESDDDAAERWSTK